MPLQILQATENANATKCALKLSDTVTQIPHKKQVTDENFTEFSDSAN